MEGAAGPGPPSPKGRRHLPAKKRQGCINQRCSRTSLGVENPRRVLGLHRRGLASGRRPGNRIGALGGPSPRPGCTICRDPLGLPIPNIPNWGGVGLRPGGVRPTPPVAAMATIYDGANRFGRHGYAHSTALLCELGAAAMAATPEAPQITLAGLLGLQ